MDKKQDKYYKTKDFVKNILALAMVVTLVFVIFTGATQQSQMQAGAQLPMGYSGAIDEESGIYIDIAKPSGWYKGEAKIQVNYEDTKGRKIKAIHAKIGEKGTWQNITDDGYIVISENSTVYIKIEDRTGRITEKSRYIECFDREKPTLKATLTGRLLRIEAHDSLSGIAAIFVNGERYDDLDSDSIEIRLTRDVDNDISIQAVDNAGNMSSTYSTKNPFNAENLARSSTTSEVKDGAASTPPAAAAPGAGTTTEKTPGTSETVGNQTAGSADGTDNTQSEEKKSNSSGSSDSPLFGTFVDTNKQFLSIVTKDGQVFYMIIDHDREAENVYLLTEVTENDLKSFSGTEKGETADSEGGVPEDTDTLIDGGATAEEVELIIAGEPSSSGSNEGSKDGVEEDTTIDGAESAEGQSEDEADGEDGKKKSPIPGWIVIGILGLILAFAGYMFLVYLPKKRANENFEDDDSDEEEEYRDEEYVIDEEDASVESSSALPTFAKLSTNDSENEPENTVTEQDNYDSVSEDEEY